MSEDRGEAFRAVDEAGGGEAEGFEQAEEALIENASHGDQHSTDPILRDASDVDEAEVDAEFGEADDLSQ